MKLSFHYGSFAPAGLALEPSPFLETTLAPEQRLLALAPMLFPLSRLRRTPALHCIVNAHARERARVAKKQGAAGRALM